MSEPEIERQIEKAPQLRLELTGAEYLSPTFAPKRMKELGFYTLSGLLPLGNFNKGHILIVEGDAWVRTWAKRILSSDMNDKELSLEQYNCVIGQSSRAAAGFNSALLSEQKTLIRENQQSKGGFLRRLFG